MALSKEEKEKRLKEQRKKKYEAVHKDINGVDNKRCNICNHYYPSNKKYYYVNAKNSVDGLYPYCIPCGINKATIRNKTHKDEIVQYKHEWHIRHKDKVNLKCKKWSKSNREKRNTTFYDFLKNNPDKKKEYSSKRNGKKHKIAIEEWDNCKEFFDGSCAYCGLHVDDHFNKYRGVLRWTDLHKEHVDPNGENDLSNCIPACRKCNAEKNTKVMNEWYVESNNKFSIERLKKINIWLENEYKKYIRIQRPKVN